jgi:Pectate lyase superfamily protein
LPTVFTLPPDTRVAGAGNPPADMNNVVDALQATGALNSVLNAAYAGGADPTGVADSTAAIQAAITAATGRVYLPAGTYKLTAALSLPNGANLLGAGRQNTKLLLANSANSRMLTLNGAGGRVAQMELDGNAANNTGTSAGIYFAAAATQPNMWVLEDLYVHDTRGNGLDLANGCGEAAKILGCWIFNAGSFGINVVPSDVTIMGTLVGTSFTDNIITQGAVTHIIDCDIYSSDNGSGITVSWGGSGNGIGTMIANCGIDRNAQHGIVVLGPSVSITGNTFHSNSQQTNNAFDSIVVDDTGHAGLLTGVTIGQNTFWVDGGITNLPKYHIEYKNTANAKTHGNGFTAGSSATGNISAASLAKDANETA